MRSVIINSKLKVVDFWMVVSLVLVVVFALSLVVSSRGVNVFRSRIGIVKPKIALAEIKQMYKDIICSCCGQDITECTCAEADEKRKLVNSLAEKGLNKNQIYEEMVKKYGEEVLFDKNLASQIKKSMTDKAPTNRPIITLNPLSVDLGDVPKKNIVSRDFKIKNGGKTDLMISSLESSCGCTTARVVNEGIEGPVFGMEGHGNFKNPTGWSTTIGVGKEAILRVFYDPNVHKDLKGPVTRIITIYSDDPINNRVKATIELNQL